MSKNPFPYQGPVTIEFRKKVPEHLIPIAESVSGIEISIPFVAIEQHNQGFTLRRNGEPFYVSFRNIKHIKTPERFLWEQN